MKRILLLSAIIVQTLLLIKDVHAQSFPIQTEYKENTLHFKNEERKFDLGVNNFYFLDLGGFVPSYDKSSFSYNGESLDRIGVDNFYGLLTNLTGNIGDKWSFLFMLTYDNGRVGYQSLQVDYHINDEWFLRAGNMKIPTTMNRNYGLASLMNHGVPMGLSLSSPRRLGVGLYNTAERHTFAAGLYTKGVMEAINEGFHGRPDLSLASRVTFNPIHEEHTKLMLGLNMEGIKMGEEAHTRILRAGMGATLNPISFIGLRLEDVNTQLNTGVELAFQYHRFLMTGEFMHSSFHLSKSDETPRFNGWDLMASYILMGKPRGYSRVAGDFSGSPRVLDKGALEAGVQFSLLDLNYKYDELEQYRGGIGTTYTAFLTYWYSAHIALSLQGTYVDHGRCATGLGSVQSINDDFAGVDLFFTQLRMAFTF
ncbi:MAG: porin [Porphyromonas sp.]|nr:porin [Porphyromonas sp.]